MAKKEAEKTGELVSCDVCLKEIPPGAGEYAETDDYVVHYCGTECYTIWKDAQKSEEKD